MNTLQRLADVSVLWPRMLWLLALLPLLIVTYMRLRGRHAHAGLVGLSSRAASGRMAALRQHGPPLLFFVGLCALLGAVARPQAVVVLPSMQKNVILAIDTSGSMRATDVKPNRLSAAQAAARTFVENQPQHSRIGIVSIAGTWLDFGAEDGRVTAARRSWTSPISGRRILSTRRGQRMLVASPE